MPSPAPSIEHQAHRTATAVPLSLYVHIPWCVRKCPYCDFNSHRQPAALPIDAYVAALLSDLALDAPLVHGRRIETVFFGGGTPSLFPPSAFATFLAGARELIELAPDAEVTMEANPGTLEHAPFAAYVGAGINRVSIGVQSFDDAALQRIGRIHGGTEARRAVEAALSAGLASVNVDLMYGLPQQDIAAALADVEQALALGVPHLSHYQLTLEPNTLFHARPPRLPDDDLAWEMLTRCRQAITGAGLRHYEVSAYARDGHRCRHNLNYWSMGDYLGIGAGAHGRLSSAVGVNRMIRQKHPRRYLETAGTGDAVIERRSVPAADLPLEFALNALRLVDGVSADCYESSTGRPYDPGAAPWSDLIGRGLLEARDDRIRPTEQGQLFLNEVMAAFLPEAADDD